MNQVETWFGILLAAAIERFTSEWNAGATPFAWVKSAAEILAKAVRKTQSDSGAGTSRWYGTEVGRS